MPEERAHEPPRTGRVSTGNTGVDTMLEGGLVPRRPYLIVGPSGTGKTTLALQFLIDGARRGERTLFVTTEEPPNEVRLNHRALGSSLDDVEVFDAIPDIMRYERTPFKDIASVRAVTPFREVPLEIRRSPELSAVEVTMTWLEQMMRSEVPRRGYSRIAIDSLTALQYFCMKGFDPVAGAQAFLRFLSDLRVTTILTVESPLEDVETPERMLARGEIRLFRWELDGRTVRAIGVEKFRGSSHDVRLHPYRIGSRGLDVNLDVTISRDTRQILETPLPPPEAVSSPVPPIPEGTSSPVDPLGDGVRDLVLAGAEVGPVRTEIEAALGAAVAGETDRLQGHISRAAALVVAAGEGLHDRLKDTVPNDAVVAGAYQRIRQRNEAARAGLPPTTLPPPKLVGAQLEWVLSLLPRTAPGGSGGTPTVVPPATMEAPANAPGAPETPAGEPFGLALADRPSRLTPDRPVVSVPAVLGLPPSEPESLPPISVSGGEPLKELTTDALTASRRTDLGTQSGMAGEGARDPEVLASTSRASVASDPRSDRPIELRPLTLEAESASPRAPPPRPEMAETGRVGEPTSTLPAPPMAPPSTSDEAAPTPSIAHGRSEPTGILAGPMEATASPAVPAAGPPSLPVGEIAERAPRAPEETLLPPEDRSAPPTGRLPSPPTAMARRPPLPTVASMAPRPSPRRTPSRASTAPAAAIATARAAVPFATAGAEAGPPAGSPTVAPVPPVAAPPAVDAGPVSPSSPVSAPAGGSVFPAPSPLAPPEAPGSPATAAVPRRRRRTSTPRKKAAAPAPAESVPTETPLVTSTSAEGGAVEGTIAPAVPLVEGAVAAGSTKPKRRPARKRKAPRVLAAKPGPLPPESSDPSGGDPPPVAARDPPTDPIPRSSSEAPPSPPSEPPPEPPPPSEPS